MKKRKDRTQQNENSLSFQRFACWLRCLSDDILKYVFLYDFSCNFFQKKDSLHEVYDSYFLAKIKRTNISLSSAEFVQKKKSYISACVRACVRTYVRACVCVCVCGGIE